MAEPGSRGRLVIERIRELPTLPEIYDRLAAAADDPDSSVWDVEKIVRQDPALTGKLLRLVNSAFYGLRRPVSTVAQAVLVVGHDALKQMVLTTSVISLFRDNGSAPLPYRDYWAHCVATAAAARQLALCLGEEHPEEFFVAGLLHDIGKLIHSEYLPELFNRALVVAKAERLPLVQAEREVMGLSHDETGGLLASRWKLAPAIQRAVASHHAPTLAANETVALHEHVVHCADIISNGMGLGFGGSYRLPPLTPLSWELLRLSTGHLAQAVRATKSEFPALMKALFDGHGS